MLVWDGGQPQQARLPIVVRYASTVRSSHRLERLLRRFALTSPCNPRQRHLRPHAPTAMAAFTKPFPPELPAAQNKASQRSFVDRYRHGLPHESAQLISQRAGTRRQKRRGERRREPRSNVPLRLGCGKPAYLITTVTCSRTTPYPLEAFIQTRCCAENSVPRLSCPWSLVDKPWDGSRCSARHDL